MFLLPYFPCFLVWCGSGSSEKAHSLTVNSLDDYLLYSQMGWIRHYPDFGLCLSQQTWHLTSAFSLFGWKWFYFMLSKFLSTSRRGRTLLCVCPRTWSCSRGARFCSQPPLIAELWKSGSLRASLPGWIQEVTIGTTKRCRGGRQKQDSDTSRHRITIVYNFTQLINLTGDLISKPPLKILLTQVVHDKYSGVFLPRYSNSSFSAMPLWEKHCWQISAYLWEIQERKIQEIWRVKSLEGYR